MLQVLALVLALVFVFVSIVTRYREVIEVYREQQCEEDKKGS